MSPLKIIALLLALLPGLAAQHDRFGTPACSAPGQEFADRSFFLLCHSSFYKVPLWVGYELKPEHLRRSARRPSHFRHDPLLSGPAAFDSDYKASGFSRGHMAPAADFAWSEPAIRATFLLSNAVPQRPAVNRGRWSQLEAAVRRIAANSDVLYVFTGPIFDSSEMDRIGPGQVAVPSHTFKVILALQGARKIMYAAIVPNAEEVREPLNHFAVTVAEVQRRTGFDFFSELEDSEEWELEARLELFPELRQDAGNTLIRLYKARGAHAVRAPASPMLSSTTTPAMVEDQWSGESRDGSQSDYCRDTPVTPQVQKLRHGRSTLRHSTARSKSLLH